MKKAIRLIKDKKFLNALDILEDSIKKEPYNIEALTNAAFCYAQTDQFLKAIDKYKLITQYSPDNMSAWQQYAYLLFKMGKIADSISVLMNALKCNSKDSWINHQLAFLNYQNSDYAGSLCFIEKTVSICAVENESQYLDLLKLKALNYEKS